MPNLTPELALPAALIALFAIPFLLLGWQVFSTDAVTYEEARKLSGSPKRVVMGLAAGAAGDRLSANVNEGIAIGYDGDTPVIVGNRTVSTDVIAPR